MTNQLRNYKIRATRHLNAVKNFAWTFATLSDLYEHKVDVGDLIKQHGEEYRNVKICIYQWKFGSRGMYAANPDGSFRIKGMKYYPHKGILN